MANRTDEGFWASSGQPARPPGRPAGPPGPRSARPSVEKRSRGGGWHRQMTIGISLTTAGAVLVIAAGVLVLLRPKADGGAGDLITSSQSGSSTDPSSDDPVPGTSASAGTSTRTVTFRYDGRRPPSELDEATLVLPDFEQAGCPTGPTKFHSGLWELASTDPAPHPRAAIAAVVIADVTGDGKSEHVTLVNCSAGGDAGSQAAQLVALGAPTGTTYPAVGKVVGFHGGTAWLFQPQVAKDGTVAVVVETRAADGKPTARQLRSFRWSGSAFVGSGLANATIQTSPTQLSLALTAGNIGLQGTASAGLHGEIAYTVSNKGGAPSTFITVALESTMPLAVTVPGSIGALARTDTGPNHQWLFTIAALGPNTTVSGRLLLAMDPAAVAGAPRSGPLNIVLTGVDVDTDQANATTTNKGKLTISRP